jgi:hypothetical protein
MKLMQRFQKTSGRHVALLILSALFIFTYYEIKSQDMQDSVVVPKTDYHAHVHNSLYRYQIGAAISSLKYDLKGYRGYTNIRTLLLSGNLNNTVIEQSFNLDHVKEKDTYTLGHIDIGFVDYAKLSFVLFGHNTEGFVYLYVLLLAISIVLYYLQYKNNNRATSLAIIFLASHLLIINALPVIGPQLETVFNYRFISVLGILPLLHLVTIIVEKVAINFRSFLVAFLQATILFFVIWIRSSAFWFVLCICIVFLWVALKMFSRRVAAKEIDSENTGPIKHLVLISWPVLLVIGFSIGLGMYETHIRETYYKNQYVGHLKWWSIYTGLAIHPDISKKYSDIDYDGKATEWTSDLCGINSKDQEKKTVIRHLCGLGEDKFKWLYYVLVREPVDQDAYSAVFKWLEDNKEEETSIFKFEMHDNVDYKTPFRWFDYRPINYSNGKNSGLPRKFDIYTDLNYKKIESILADISVEIATSKFPQMMSLLTLQRPIQLGYYYLKYFVIENTLITVVFIISLIYGLIRGGPRQFREKYHSIILIMVLCSMIVPISFSPYYYAMSDTGLMFNLYLITLLSMGFFRKSAD